MNAAKSVTANMKRIFWVVVEVPDNCRGFTFSLNTSTHRADFGAFEILVAQATEAKQATNPRGEQ